MGMRETRQRAAVADGAMVSTIADGAWSAVRIIPHGRVWQIEVEGGPLPDEAAAAVVLTGRSSGAQVEISTAARGGVIVADVRVADLAVFGPEVVDLWVDLRDDGEVARRRIGSAVSAGDIAAAGLPGARWYATVKGNLSVEVAPPLSGQHVRPTLVAAQADDDGWRVAVEGVGAEGEAHLVAQGRRTGIKLHFALTGAAPRWSASIGSERLAVLNGDVVDFYVSGHEGTGPKARLAAGLDLAGVAKADLRTWYATVEGNVSIRRKTAVEAIRDAGAFDVDHYRAQVPELAPDADPIEHYVTVGANEGLDPSTMFETRFYVRSNPGVQRMNPFAHYCEYGWKELRNPSPKFDTWWYWSKHLDLGSERVMPLAHYEEVGKHQGLSTRPERFPSRRLGTGHRYADGRRVTRVCLFAAYDAHGVVDDYVVDYLRELSRFADVYYLADSEMAPSELAKLDTVTKGAWAQRHGEYDFGSFARLAGRVGWDEIEKYDELLLANDSCYLLRPLDEVFAEMDRRACDWWGLQSSTRRHTSRDPHRVPISHRSLDMLVDRVESRQSDYLHVSSYFAAYRQPVLRDPEFRRYLLSVTGQTDKTSVIQKYEIGLSRWLVNHGHRFETFIRDVYPYHPTYNGWYFRLLDQGFPLLKRQLLSVNPFGVRGLASWKERILAKVPDADVEMFERNLHRVIDASTLDATLERDPDLLATTEEPSPVALLEHDDFRRADRRLAKDAALWVFSVDPVSGAFTGSGRSVFEAVKDEPSIRKAVLSRGAPLDLDGVNVEVVDLESPEGQARVLRAGTILVGRTLAAEMPYPISGEFHNVVHLGAGEPHRLMAIAEDAARAEGNDDAQYRAIVGSSKVEVLALTAASYPLTFHQVWNTGLPRADFIGCDEDRLPADMHAELVRLRDRVGNRRLLLWTAGDGLALAPDDASWLSRWLVENDGVLGVRGSETTTWTSSLDGGTVIHLPEADFVHREVLLREAAALVTDFSSAFVDYLVTGRPMVGVAPARETAQGADRDMEAAFPGAVVRTPEALRSALDGIFGLETDSAYQFKRRLFHDHFDGMNALRVAERIRDLTEVYGVGKRLGERMA